jgi:GTP-binding protein
MKEKETNLGLRIEEGRDGVDFTIHGRGELHLAILIETMRREGYEMQVSKPQVIYKSEGGVVSEPYEEVTVDVPQKYFGEVSQEFGQRKAELINMHTDHNDNTRIVYKISSQNLIGVRNILMTKTRGTAVLNSYFLGYEAKGPKIETARAGALIASQAGVTNSYGLANAQSRGTLFVGVGVPVYQGMVVGEGTREQDIEVNVCRTKQLTNNRSSGEGTSVQVEPASPLSLEQAIDFINEDELLEVTPQNIRVRKKYLTEVERKRASRQQQSL